MKAAPMEICISQPLVPTPNFRLLHKQGGGGRILYKKNEPHCLSGSFFIKMVDQ